jgi:hypothetical protein
MFCTRDDPTQQCVERREAVQRGAFIFAWNAGRAGAWIWKDAKSNPWRVCPWCGGDLPTLEDAVKRLWDMDGTAGWDEDDPEAWR